MLILIVKINDLDIFAYVHSIHLRKCKFELLRA